MQTQTPYPFTKEQFDALNPEGKQVIDQVTDYLTGVTLTGDPNLSSDTISEALNLLKPCEGSVPSEYADEDLLNSIRQKFAAVYESAIELAEQELVTQGLKLCEDFNFCLVIEPSNDDCTHIVILDFKRPAICYLHEWTKAWNYHFATLQALAEDVLRVRHHLVEQVLSVVKPKEIMVVVQGGIVHEIVNLPEHIQVSVIDYDVEDLEHQHLSASPIDGELCRLTKW